jgi:hypothetical protein
MAKIRNTCQLTLQLRQLIHIRLQRNNCRQVGELYIGRVAHLILFHIILEFILSKPTYLAESNLPQSSDQPNCDY